MNNTSDKISSALGIFGVICICLSLLLFMGKCTSDCIVNKNIKKEAIERGFAYYTNDSLGNSYFVWNTNLLNKVEK